MLVYLAAGLTTGSVFGLAALGLVLTYRTSGVFNFAHGALATFSAFLFYFFYVQLHWPWYLAAIVVIAVAGGGLGTGLELLTRRWSDASGTMRVLGTVGLLLVIQGAIDIVWSPGVDREVPQFLPVSTFNIGSTPIGYYRVIFICIGLASAIALSAYLRKARGGLAMRAVVDNADLLDLSRTASTGVRRRAWILGSAMASVSGILLAPLLSLDATGLTFLVVTAFGAAAVGIFRNLPLTYAGGLAIGIAQTFMEKYFASSLGLVSGLAASLPFILLFVLLLVGRRLPQTRLQSSVRSAASQVSAWRAPLPARVIGLAALVAFLAAVPEFGGLYLVDWTRMLAYAVLFLSLGLLVRVSGQVSLAHMTFMAIGVTAFSQATQHLHLPWLVALLFSGLVALPFGALLSIPAIRFPGVYLALATLGFGILVEYMFYGQSYMFGPLGLPLTVPRPGIGWLSSDTGFYYLVLVIAVIIAVGVVGIERSRLGRLLRAIGDSPSGVASTGASVNVSLVVIFCVTAMLAAVAGALDGAATTQANSTYYQPILSLQFFAVVLLMVGGFPWYAVLAAISQTILPDYLPLSGSITYILTLLFGLGALIVSGAPPRRVPAVIQHWLAPLDNWWPRRRSVAAAVRKPTAAASNASDQRRLEGCPDLVLAGITVRYGGLVAAENVTLTAPGGAITGLIGPNGAGKSTVFNACTGLVKAASGEAHLGDVRLTRMESAARARHGLGRTFQHLELFESLTVRENVAMGAEGSRAGWNPISHLVQTRHQRAAVGRETERALDLCGLSALASRPVASLSTGQRRLVELARCVAGPFTFLLLDEPSSGLDRVETERFGDILADVVAHDGRGILLIEHDMSLVNRLCSQVHVLDFGNLIFSGTTSEMQQSPLVQSAYLGVEGSLPRVASAAELEGEGQ